MKRRVMLLITIAVVITAWQVAAGIQRCGTLDGGVLLVPVLMAIRYLVQGVTKELKESWTSPDSPKP